MNKNKVTIKNLYIKNKQKLKSKRMSLKRDSTKTKNLEYYKDRCIRLLHENNKHFEKN